MKHILLISILIFSSFLVSCEKKSRVLYLWETPSGGVWKSIGDDTQLKYNGEIKHGKPDGVGEMEHPVIGNYVGEFKDGVEHGQGTRTYPDGSMYVGEFKDGKYDGQGKLTFPDGTKYVGEFNDGKKNGQGTLTFPNVKESKDGEYDGKGTLILSDGSKYVGKWKDDEPWNVTVYDIDGNILRRRIVNGVLK